VITARVLYAVTYDVMGFRRERVETSTGSVPSAQGIRGLSGRPVRRTSWTSVRRASGCLSADEGVWTRLRPGSRQGSRDTCLQRRTYAADSGYADLSDPTQATPRGVPCRLPAPYDIFKDKGKTLPPKIAAGEHPPVMGGCRSYTRIHSRFAVADD